MKAARFAGLLVAVALLVPTVFAAEDLTGIWSGAFNTSIDGGAPNPDVAYMVIKHTGAEVNGTVGPNADQQWSIEKGKVAVATVDGKESTKVTFEVHMNGTSDGPLIRFELELVGGHLKGKANGEFEGMTMAAEVDLARSK